ncbi:hypothetical protein [Bosea vaviloviae]|uniref:Holliday junction resolvase RuvC n=1 Tax=Bosea vaviloviae TaxID=1526658 RepID=A0A0N0MB25_9HYPH|nr:hypothetical protein [Bosea vaviloviae]KPH79345.1 hypothetical protein AE618_18785 [Bosea vaviloviae]
MNLLTFDIGVKTGWCAAAIGEPLRGGTRRLAPSGSEHAKVAAEQMQFVGDMIALNKPDRVAFEFSTQTIAGKQGSGFTNIDTILMQAGMRWVILGICKLMDVRCDEIQPAQARIAFLGKGKGRLKREDAKLAVKRECFIRGIEYADDNHSDAVCLWFALAFRIDADFAARDAVARMRMRDPCAGGDI